MWSLYSHVFLIVAPWLIRDGHLQPAGFQQRFEIFLGEVLGILIASVLHDFRFGARFCAKNKDTLIVGLIGGLTWVPSCGPTFSTATGVRGMTVRNTSPSINSGVPPE